MLHFMFSSIAKNEVVGIALEVGIYLGKSALMYSISGGRVNHVNLDGTTGIEYPNSDSRAFTQVILMPVKLNNLG